MVVHLLIDPHQTRSSPQAKRSDRLVHLRVWLASPRSDTGCCSSYLRMQAIAWTLIPTCCGADLCHSNQSQGTSKLTWLGRKSWGVADGVDLLQVDFQCLRRKSVGLHRSRPL